GKAVEIAIEVMKKLPRQPANKNEFINLESWINGLSRAVESNFETKKVAKAQKFFAELVEPFEKKILLHGDVHFDNILSAQREPFLLIDPKGLVGEIGYEIAVFLNDLADWCSHLKNQKEILAQAVENFAKAFDTDAKSLRKWAFAYAVLSAWWMIEDFGNNKEKDILRAEIWDV
ncbi:MAG: aminoglycoside phosphotransferase family protein, partial [Pyrinomonadaceae bacterium]